MEKSREDLFALTILKVLRLEFWSRLGKNPIHFGFENREGNSIYVSCMNDKLTVSAFKATRRSCLIEIENEADINIMSDELVSALKLHGS